MAAGSALRPENSSTTRVLCVGTATLDIVNRVPDYPAEDSEVRALSQSQRMGGNAANTAIVLAQLGVQTSWAGTLAERAEVIEHAFAHYRVDADLATRVAGGTMPTSYITLSEATGSRSIIHYRDLPEYGALDFKKLGLSDFAWVHFEGRAVDELQVMLRYARSIPRLTVSLEIEKPRDGIEALFEHADLLLFSRDYATAKGFGCAEELLRTLLRGQRATCTWGAQGAWAVERDGRMMHAVARRQPAVVDTVGAGDVFNAAMVNELGMGRSLQEALQAAVDLASSQCAHEGLTLADGP